MIQTTSEITARTPPLGMPETTRSPELPRWDRFEQSPLTIPSGTVIPGSPLMRLEREIFASVNWTSDGIVIASPMLDEDGYGETLDTAWADFLVSLKDRYASLTKREASLSLSDRAVLGLLRESLITLGS